MAMAERAICIGCGRDMPVTTTGLRAHKDQFGSRCAQQPRRAHIALPWTAPPLAQNDRQHWRAKAESFARAKSEARWAIRAAHVDPMERAIVTLHYRVPDRRVRDADGPAPTLKAVLDALVAEAVIPADDWQHVPRISIQMHPPQPSMPPALWITLAALPTQSRPARGGSSHSKDTP